MKRTRKQIRQDRIWKHFLHWLSPTPMGYDLKPMENYDPERWRAAFEKAQSLGQASLTPEERNGIKPLMDAQRAKEVLLTSLAQESFEFWCHGLGWIHPWNDTLNPRSPTDHLDRLTKVAILRTIKKIAKDSLAFFQRHPGITDAQRAHGFAIKWGSVS